ncbi:transcriptional regulator, AraC family [Rhodococcus aetherivorans]|uniref:Transcriptional regulator, AraC family n=1 Tax=Rhodococcus aetherivorans TaxID=191292 RepID=A0ABQ0YVJ6_9NOCA|nr:MULTISPECIES: AraC family transcriptional regulator [Rhodococcus]NGP29466.1 AraC family transcriptional regulator [Rhodococcus aetherivorans]PND51055.1 AraC family transcriptional regulator [Rhodococcus sp. ENV425]WKW98331.1 AraC family transcriptional regulator [Rhodococcus aetherivorans]GES40616.1 transcriptional regulator, AraC family [Rhodococcus aetherivorans]
MTGVSATYARGVSATEIGDWDAASRAVADAYFPHELTDLSGTDRPKLSLTTVDLGGVTLGRLHWGADIAIACDYPGAYEVNIPVTGRLESRGSHGETVSVPGQATVFRADTPSVITHWGATCSVLGVKFDREHLEREADRILGSPVRSKLELPDQLDLTGPASEWHGLVRALSEQLDGALEVVRNPVVGAQLAGAVTAAFVLAVAPQDGPAGPPRPGMIRRVLDSLHDDPGRAWTSADMAELAGTSVRRLQEAFAHFVGRSPSACLLDIRLDRAHADLVAGAGAVTVADVAYRWGFSHPGRFAAAFKRRYGTTPAEVLRGR